MPPERRSNANANAPETTQPPSRAPTRAPSPAAGERQQPPPPPPPPPPQQQRRRVKRQAPQKSIDEFWDKFTTKTPGKAFTILPDNLYAKRAAAHAPKGAILGQNAVASYDEAAAACKAKVAKIVKECRRINQKYRDPHFDIEADFKRSLKDSRTTPDCLCGLDQKWTALKPLSVKRVEDIFERPEFFIQGATASDVRQGKDGDCWFMSALCTLSNKEGLIQKVCVEKDEQVGVYGFVFHRDGEWISEVIDDKLYLIKEDFDESVMDRNQWLELQNRTSPEEEYRTVMQTGSRALYFAQCSDPNETWLPLLEKAYAKAHGDYSAIDGGFVGEGIEDLTGGVTTELFATDILDKDKFWKEELMNVNKQFLFGCGQMGGIYGQRKGILEKHAYSIMEARDIDGKRLLKLRNPWGNTEWRGAWSDGSAEWTPEWMTKLDHSFGDDGVFWISYHDLLRNYQHFDRTRLFSDEWTVTQQWTSLNVPWSVDYLDTKFKITLTESSPVVIVLSQLDDRYFYGLQGQYEFHLSFRLHQEGEDDYIVRSNSPYFMKRSVSTELDLEAGNYSVLLKITAKRSKDERTPEQVIRETCRTRREKLLSIGLSYDLAHAKGRFKELESEKKAQDKQERYETKRANYKKAKEARLKLRRKQKLHDRKAEAKRLEKAAKKLQEKAERTATENGTSTPNLDDYRLDQDPSRAQPNGLGISVNNDDAPDTTASAVTPFHRRINSLDHANPRPSTPPTTNGRTASPKPGPLRRDTLSQPIPPSRRNTLSPVPHVTLHRASGSSTTKLSDVSDDEPSWDSAIDGPSSEAESDAGGCGNGGPRGRQRDAHPGMGEEGLGGKAWEEDEEEDDEFERDPWNAVCVVGLRVYSKDTEVKIEVVKPREDGTRGRRGMGMGEKGLDVDDSAKDATKGLEKGGADAVGGAPQVFEASRSG